jgi:hypothetical protein
MAKQDDERGRPAEVDDVEPGGERRSDATPTVPILIPREYVEAHRRDSEPPAELHEQDLAELGASESLPGAPPLPAGAAATRVEPPPVPSPAEGKTASEARSAREAKPASEAKPAPPAGPEALAASASSIAPTETRSRPSRRPEPEPQERRKWPLLLLAAGLIGLLALGLRQTPSAPPEAPAAAASVATPAPPVAPPEPSRAAAPAPETAPDSEPGSEAVRDDAPDAVALAEPEPVPVQKSAPVAVAPQGEPAPAPAEAAPAPRSRKQRVAGSRKPRKPRKRAQTPDPAQAELPETPARADVVAAMTSIRTAAAACTQGQHGLAELEMTLSADGRVRHAQVGGYFHGTPIGSCIAREVRKARVPPFQQTKYRVFYPLSL